MKNSVVWLSLSEKDDKPRVLLRSSKSGVFGMQLKVIWAKSLNGYPAWICQYSSFKTESTVSPMKCFKSHLKKLEAMGVDISKIDPVPKIIGRTVNEQ